MNNFQERLGKCYTGVVHDIMRDMGYKNFTLPPQIRPCKNNHILALKYDLNDYIKKNCFYIIQRLVTKHTL